MSPGREPQLECVLQPEVQTMVHLMWAWDMWGGVGGCLQWPAISAGLQLYAFFGSKSVDPQNHGNSVLVPPALIIPPTQSPTATAWLLRTHLRGKSWPSWVCELWLGTQAKLAHTSSCLFGWLTEGSEHIFPSLAASCSYWLAHSLFGTTQHSCVNAAAWTDVQLYRVLQKSIRLSFPQGWRLGAVASMGTSDMDPSFFLPVATY